MVTTEIKIIAKKHIDLLHDHSNLETIQLLDNEWTLRRLKETQAV
jgi:hypothetical protein